VILGASHITLACGDMVRGTADLAKIGYKVVFAEPALPSDPGKTPLLSTPRNIHSVAFTRAPWGLPIELVYYDASLPEPCGRFVGLFDMPAAAANGDPILARLADVAAQAFDRRAVPSVLPGFDAPAVYAPSGTEHAGLKAAMLSVDDLDRSQRLWSNGLGFREAATGDGWVRLDLGAPVPAWQFTIVLVGSAEPVAAPWLDGRGMTCLSFLCSSVERAGDVLTENGALRAMSPFRSCVNGKHLNVDVLRGTAGEFIELIEICR